MLVSYHNTTWHHNPSPQKLQISHDDKDDGQQREPTT